MFSRLLLNSIFFKERCNHLYFKQRGGHKENGVVSFQQLIHEDKTFFVPRNAAEDEDFDG